MFAFAGVHQLSPQVDDLAPGCIPRGDIPACKKKEKAFEIALECFLTIQVLADQLRSARNCKPGSVSSWRKSPMSIAKRLIFLYRV